MATRPASQSAPREEALQRTVDEYKALTRKLAGQVDSLSSTLKSGQQEYNEVTSYLNKEIKKLSDEKKTMQDVIEAAVLQDEAQRTRAAADLTVAVARVTAESDANLKAQLADNASMRKELHELRYFREEKEAVDRAVQRQNDAYEAQIRDLKTEMATLERSFLMQYDKQQKDAELKLQEVRHTARETALRSLDIESQEIRIELVEVRPGDCPMWFSPVLCSPLHLSVSPRVSVSVLASNGWFSLFSFSVMLIGLSCVPTGAR